MTPLSDLRARRRGAPDAGCGARARGVGVWSWSGRWCARTARGSRARTGRSASARSSRTSTAKIALEWGHRVIAGSLSLGAGRARRCSCCGRRELRARFAAPLLVVVSGCSALQIVLGGLTVLLGLAPWTVTAHLLVGNSFALGLAWLVARPARRCARTSRSRRRGARRAAARGSCSPRRRSSCCSSRSAASSRATTRGSPARRSRSATATRWRRRSPVRSACTCCIA